MEPLFIEMTIEQFREFVYERTVVEFTEKEVFKIKKWLRKDDIMKPSHNNGYQINDLFVKKFKDRWYTIEDAGHFIRCDQFDGLLGYLMGANPNNHFDYKRPKA